MPLSTRLPPIGLSSMFNPIYLLGPPILLVVSIPLATFAVITTSIAVITLLFRVAFVYFELGVALVHGWLFSKSSLFSPRSLSLSKAPSPGSASPLRPRSLRNNSTTTTASSSRENSFPRLHNKNGSFASLVGSGEPTRDYEGVGGWRVPGENDDEALWIGINSRLELPAVVTPGKRVTHQRSLTSSSQRFSASTTYSPEAFRISPMQSRARTPAHSRDPSNSPESYFPPLIYSRNSTGSDLAGRYAGERGRKSPPTTTTSSSTSSRRTSVARQVGD